MASLRGVATFLLFVLAGIGVIALDGPPHPLAEQAPLPVFAAGRALRHLRVISRAPHPINSAEHEVVRDYILRTLRGLGLTPEVQRTTEVNQSYGIQGALENIVCRLPGRTKEKAVLLVAHYDSVPAGPGAGDNGVSVAGFLESARALTTLPQLKRDVIFLFTDGEERGMLGAQAFVREHAWAHDVAFVLNFDARGDSGASIMFETSDDNGWLISNFGHAASHPVANSLSYEIYKRMPNNTDFTIFRRAGYPGLNFAFIDGLPKYHTASDSIDNVNLGTLQHQGDSMLEMTRQLANTASDDPRYPSVVYFDVFGRLLIRYKQSTALWLLALAGILVAGVVYLGLQKGYLQAAGVALGTGAMLLGVSTAVLGSQAAFQAAVAVEDQVPGIRLGLWYHSGLYVLAFSAIGLACATAFYWVASRWIDPDNLAAGSLVGWFGLTVALAAGFPGAAYLLLWPLLFSSSGWIAVFGRRHDSENTRAALLTVTALPAIILIVPIVHKIFLAFGARSILIVSVFLGLLIALLIAQICRATFTRQWLLPLLLALAGTGLLISAVTVSVAKANSKSAAGPVVAGQV